jgi:hypothetical protein
MKMMVMTLYDDNPTSICIVIIIIIIIIVIMYIRYREMEIDLMRDVQRHDRMDLQVAIQLAGLSHCPGVSIEQHCPSLHSHPIQLESKYLQHHLIRDQLAAPHDLPC